MDAVNTEEEITLLIFGSLFFVVALFIGCFIYFYSSHMKVRKKLKKEELETKTDDIVYYRDIPFKNIEQAFWVANYYGMTANISDFIGAILLKWIKEKKIEVTSKDGKMIIDMTKFFKKESEFETDLYIKLLVSAKKDKIVEEEEFIEFFQNDSKRLFAMFKKLSIQVENELAAENLLTIEENRYGTRKITVSDELKEKALQLQGLKNFLSDFSIINERQTLEITVWEEYLMYAQLLGIADKVESEFERVYPNYNLVLKDNIQKLAVADALKTTGNFIYELIVNSCRSKSLIFSINNVIKNKRERY